VHHASLQEVLRHFGEATIPRKLVGMRLKRVYELAVATGGLKRFIVFGSFVTAKPDPNDVDVFLVMHDTFDLSQVTGASIFWLRPLSALPSEEETILGWQLKRDGTRRGIVEATEA
jgi:hypothetical protein